MKGQTNQIPNPFSDTERLVWGAWVTLCKSETQNSHPIVWLIFATVGTLRPTPGKLKPLSRSLNDIGRKVFSSKSVATIIRETEPAYGHTVYLWMSFSSWSSALHQLRYLLNELIYSVFLGGVPC